MWVVWCLWTDVSEHLVTLHAADAESAVESAVRMGLVSGLGVRGRYRGLHATRLDRTVR